MIFKADGERVRAGWVVHFSGKPESLKRDQADMYRFLNVCNLFRAIPCGVRRFKFELGIDLQRYLSENSMYRPDPVLRLAIYEALRQLRT